MKRLAKGRGTPAAIAAILTLLIAGGGYAIASGGGTINACASKGTHVLYTGKCKKGDKKISWNQQGPKGAKGATGLTGPRGIQGIQGPPGPSTITQSGLLTAKAGGSDVTLASSGTLKLVGRCASPSAGLAQARLVIENNSTTATAQWDDSTGTGGTNGSTIAASSSTIPNETLADDETSGQGVAQGLFTVVSADGSHMAVTAFAAAGGALVGTTNNCEFDATELQGAPGS